MTTIIIRLKSLLIFGVVLLGISFVWIGLRTFLPGQAELPASITEEAMQKTAEQITDPTVTIVAEEPTQKLNDSFFSEYRIERERTRSERVEILREIVSNVNSSAQMRLEAQQKLIKISDDLEKESKIENALRAKGFVDAIAVIQPESVMVIVPSNGLRQDEIVRIADIVVKVAVCKMEDVVIVPKAM